jgi:hypothetical protein
MKRILVDPTSNIRSSQRLSHACLSTYLTKVKPQKAQYNSCNFLDHIPSTWITVENLELIHALMRVPLLVLVQLLDKPTILRDVYFGGTLDNFADRMAFVPTIDLSNVWPINFDGSIEDYHGCYG